MVGLDHGANQPDDDENPATTARNTKNGLLLFAVYVVIYGSYVLANAFAPWLMEYTIAGVTVAILSGFALIIAAFVLALIYGWLCRAPAESSPGKESRS